MNQWPKFLEVFNSKNIKIVTVLMTLLTTVIVLIVNIYTLHQSSTLEGARLLYIRDWAFFADDNGWIVSVLFYAGFVMAIIGGFLFLKVRVNLKEIETSKSGPQQMRKLLSTTTSFMSIGLFIEGLYILFKSDFKGAYEVIFQLSTPYNTFVMVIFIVIVISIFMDNDLIKNPKLSLILIGFLNTVVIVGYIMMMIYGFDPDAFSMAIVLAIAIMVVVGIVALIIVFRIFSLRQKVKDEDGALFSISIIVLLLVLSIFLLIACGLTVNKNTVANMVFRSLRIGILLLTGILYYPAFILPAKKNK